MKSALEDFSALAARLEGRRPVVFLDFDGTLSEVVPHHGDAEMLPAAREAVRELARHVPVVVVSGRDRRDVAERVALPHLWYAGSHGFDIAGPDGAGHHEPDPKLAPLMEEVADELRRELADVPGAVVEAKRFAISVHHRGLGDAARRRADDVVERVVAGDERLARSVAKMVYEVRPAMDWDKGAALEHLLGHQALAGTGGRGDGVVPVYVGDDLTDEDAFRAVQRHPGAGVTVHVTGHDTDFESCAEWSLASPREVVELLRRMAAVVATDDAGTAEAAGR